MNLNLWAYGIYFLITFVVVILVGRICYINGNKYVLTLVSEHEDICQRVNRLLLLGYYLMNLGFVAISLVFWETIDSIPQLIEMLSMRIGFIVVSIALMHYFNLFWLSKYLKKLVETGDQHKTL